MQSAISFISKIRFWVRYKLKNSYNWSTIRPLAPIRVHSVWIIILIPLIFSLLYEVRGVIERVELATEKVSVLGLRFKVADEVKDQSTVKTEESILIPSWETSMVLLFLAATCSAGAAFLHRLGPSLVRSERREEYATKVRQRASASGEVDQIIEEHAAYELLNTYEKFFNEEWSNFPNLLEDNKEVVRLKTIYSGAEAEYDVASVKRVPIMFFCYLMYGVSIFCVLILFVKRVAILYRGF